MGVCIFSNQRNKCKKLIEDLSKSTFSFPRVKANGDFGFVTIKSEYGVNDWEEAKVINPMEIISYQFSMSDAKDVVSEYELDYAFDYATNKYSKNIFQVIYPYPFKIL